MAAADAADAADYASLTREQRVDITLELVDRYRESLGEAGQRFERVMRITSFAELRDDAVETSKA